MAMVPEVDNEIINCDTEAKLISYIFQKEEG